MRIVHDRARRVAEGLAMGATTGVTTAGSVTEESVTFAEVMMWVLEFGKSAGIDDLEGYVGRVFEHDLEEPSMAALTEPKREKYNRRYDKMIEKFNEWKDFIPDGEGRRLDILRGCFVGSENPAVVEALRVIYTDHTALRLSGDWIFKVVSAIMNVTTRRRRGRDRR